MSDLKLLDTNKLIYLACPYSDESYDVKLQRYKAANRALAQLSMGGFFVFSPISMCHQAAQDHDLPGDFEYWSDLDLVMLSRCDCLLVLKVEGWNKSYGVVSEIAMAKAMRMPILYFGKEELGIWINKERAKAEKSSIEWRF